MVRARVYRTDETPQPLPLGETEISFSADLQLVAESNRLSICEVRPFLTSVIPAPQ